MSGKLFILTGKSSTGKDTLVKSACDERYFYRSSCSVYDSSEA